MLKERFLDFLYDLRRAFNHVSHAANGGGKRRFRHRDQIHLCIGRNGQKCDRRNANARAAATTEALQRRVALVRVVNAAGRKTDANARNGGN